MKGSKLSLNKLKKINYNGLVLNNFSLKELTTFRIGGKAKYYLEITTLENFIQVILYLQRCNAKYFVIGNGSNLLVSDKGYSSVILKLKGDFARCEQIEDNLIEYGAGVTIGEAFAYSRNLGLGGLEDSAGIPATIGGAITMNASAYNFEMAQLVEYVVAYFDGKIRYFNKIDCNFGYRESVFQKIPCVILRVGLRLNTADKEVLQNRYLEVLTKRKSTQPINLPSAGCVFRRMDNLMVSKVLDEDGFKGRRIGGAVVSEKHANFIVNDNNATAQNVYDLINIIKKEFESKHGQKLSCEINFLGEFDEVSR